jgi:hypothetical protein
MKRAACAVALAALLVACGGNDDDDAADDSRRATTTTAPAETTTTLDRVAAEAEIRSVFERFFDGNDTDDDGKLTLLSDPEAIRTFFLTKSNDPSVQSLADTTTGRVEKVAFTDDTTAEVDFNLLQGGQPVTEGTFLGRATLVDGEWRVTNDTFCNMMALLDPAVRQDPACAET